MCLRQNLIRVIEGLNGLDKLEYLDLYDNKIDEIPVSTDPEPQNGEKKWIYGLNLPSLTYLDLCFNNIVHIENLDRVPNLKSLYLAQNSIRVIKGLSGLSELCTLELGANRIRKIEGLDVLYFLLIHFISMILYFFFPFLFFLLYSFFLFFFLSFPHFYYSFKNVLKFVMVYFFMCVFIKRLKKLENLWLGKNKITQIDGLSELTNLKVLSLQNNRIIKMEVFLFFLYIHSFFHFCFIFIFIFIHSFYYSLFNIFF